MEESPKGPLHSAGASILILNNVIGLEEYAQKFQLTLIKIKVVRVIFVILYCFTFLRRIAEVKKEEERKIHKIGNEILTKRIADYHIVFFLVLT